MRSLWDAQRTSDEEAEDALQRWSETGIIPRRKDFLVWLFHRMQLSEDSMSGRVYLDFVEDP